VTDDTIGLATTVVDSGIGAPFLRDVRFAIDAVVGQVNASGGICGRKIRIVKYVDDAWDPTTGATFLRDIIDEKSVFGIPVGPSSEGLRVVIRSGDLDHAGIPVIGADGMLINEYVRDDGTAQPWVWPVAAATVASARIMVQSAWKSGARSFGIVFDKNYRFGQEAAKAFNSEVRRITGHDVQGFNRRDNCEDRYCGIQSGQSNYPNEVGTYYKGKVDFTALFLEPQTALTWMNDPNTHPANDTRYGAVGAAQPLFTRDFAQSCGSKCDQMMVWTGFKPYIESYKSDPAVQSYVQAMQRTNPQADIFNAFAEGGYVGMQLFVQGLREAGPYLTRERLQYALDRTVLKTGLTLQPELRWRPGVRYVNTTMQGFSIQFRSTFAGWREGPIEHDPHPDSGIS
jgi:branched-chain amino acid transport system substrate-binding protein